MTTNLPLLSTNLNSVRLKTCNSECRTGCLEDEPDVCCDDECVAGCTGTDTNCVVSILKIFPYVMNYINISLCNVNDIIILIM